MKRSQKIKRIIIGCILFLVITTAVGCGNSSIPAVENPTRSISQMTDLELQQMIDRHYEIIMTDRRASASSAYALRVIIFQNEQLRRLLQNKKLEE